MELIDKIAEFFAFGYNYQLPETESPDRLETPFDHVYMKDGREVKVSWEANLKTGEIYEIITPVEKPNIFQKIFKRR